jgi:hypothetical protein
MLAWADQLRVEKGENLAGMSEVNVHLLAGLVTPMETVTAVPTEAGIPLADVISTWPLVRCNIGAALMTAVWTLPVLAVLNVAARAPTLTAYDSIIRETTNRPPSSAAATTVKKSGNTKANSTAVLPSWRSRPRPRVCGRGRTQRL